MLSPSDLYGYQREAILHGLYHKDSMLWLGLGLGKEQPVSEPVLTPSGWVPIGSIRQGDRVVGSDGKPTVVTGVYPQGRKAVVKVTMSDGSWTRCGWDHLWTVRTSKDRARGKPWRTISTKEMPASGLRVWNNRKWEIPMVAPVQAPEKALPLDPYALGVILGGGAASPWDCTVCADLEVTERAGFDFVRPHETSGYTVYAVARGSRGLLMSLGLLGKRSWEKSIPEPYLRASAQQRLAILQGLLDTGGSPITCGGGLEYSSTSEALADGVTELTESLGGVARKHGPRVTAHQGGLGRPSWRVNVKLPSHIIPFTLRRKLDRWVRPTKYHASRRVDRIEDTGLEEESVCLRVAAADSLYVTRRHILTHNTSVALTVALDRMRAGQIQKLLVFGPLRVVHSVWHAEARKWSHLKHLRFSLIQGDANKRRRALFAKADVYLCNYENMSWLAEELGHYFTSRGRPLPWQMVVYDEVTRVKNSTGVRINGGKRDIIDPRTGKETTINRVGWRTQIDNFRYRMGLTGSPATNGYLDLHGQFLAVDGGERLGARKTSFKENYFSRGWDGYSYNITDLGKQQIESRISDITLKMDTREYRVDMPDAVESDVWVDLPPRARKVYRDMEAEMFAELDDGRNVEVFSGAAAYTKTLQIANGSVYVEQPPLDESDRAKVANREWSKIHDAKIKALQDVVEDANGRPVLVSYSFKTDAARIMQTFKGAVNLTAEPASSTERIVQEWKDGKISMLIAHPASAGHGIDGLQDGGNIVVWFGVNWRLELYLQMNARIDRPGQKHPVSIVRILARDTLDEVVSGGLASKATDEKALKDAIHAYRNRKAGVTFL